jgi:hypothetical protein
MSALTLQELNSVNPEKIFDLPLTLNINLWNSISLPTRLPNPIKIEFNEKIRDILPSTVKEKKGIYMFVVEPNFPFDPDIKYPIYIGRVLKTNTFFKRFYEYVDCIGNCNVKRNRQLMTNAWPLKTFVYYYVLTNDAEIEMIEKELVDKIIPPLNNMFCLKEATNTRSLYK